MHLIDILLLLAVLAVAALAARSVFTRKKRGGGCGCDGCTAACPVRPEDRAPGAESEEGTK